MKSEQEILSERARLIAGRRTDNETGDEHQLRVIEFYVNPERYAVSEEFATEVFLLKEITPVPGVPAFIMGVVNLRGRIVSVVDLRKFFGLKERGLTELNKVIMLKNETMEFGIVADSVLGARLLNRGDLCPPPANLQVSAELVEAVHTDGLILLDAQKILESKQLIIK